MNLIEEIADSWGWAGIQPLKVVGENDFGNLMIEDVEGRYWRLCPEDTYCKVVASSRQELNDLSSDPEFLEDWYMKPLVENASNQLGGLEEGYKFHLIIPGVLGGAYDVSNVAKVPLVELVRLSGHIALQIRDLPDGAKGKLRVVD